VAVFAELLSRMLTFLRMTVITHKPLPSHAVASLDIRLPEKRPCNRSQSSLRKVQDATGLISCVLTNYTVCQCEIVSYGMPMKNFCTNIGSNFMVLIFTVGASLMYTLYTDVTCK